MFSSYDQKPGDPLLSLITQYKADTRENRIDLGVGVYRDDQGQTPVMRSVKAAETYLVSEQISKAYLGPEGNNDFTSGFTDLILGPNHGRSVAGLQAPGGTGALALALKLVASGNRHEVHIGLPTWPNHMALLQSNGLDIRTYTQFDTTSQSVTFGTVLDALGAATQGSIVLLHACCHNPTGADFTQSQWTELRDIVVERGLIPLIDAAYLGLGDGLETDLTGLRLMASSVPELLIAASCSKSFGLYRERTGALLAISDDPKTVKAVQSNFSEYARVSYSMPPDHGAAVVAKILADDGLRKDWMTELASMVARITKLRMGLAEALDWTHSTALAQQKGMFSLLPLSETQVGALREDHGVYMPSSGRINIAGLTENTIPRLAAILRPMMPR
ncbi:MAG: aromatic amino acid transaminase [Qingshengfaniella sp.]